MVHAEQEQWAAQLRSIPDTFYNALQIDNEQAIRHRPALGEWSALEVMGHMIDKMQHWSRRVNAFYQRINQLYLHMIKMPKFESMLTRTPILQSCANSYSKHVNILHRWLPLFPLLCYNAKAYMLTMDL